MATNKDDKELKNQTLDEEKQDADQVDLSTDQNQISENTAEEEADNNTDDEDTSSKEDEDLPNSEENTAKDDTENTAEEKRKESKAKSEPRVFYVEGYGNVNGCKTQAEAEKKAKKLIDAVRR